jgi:hypothetical protein
VNSRLLLAVPLAVALAACSSGGSKAGPTPLPSGVTGPSSGAPSSSATTQPGQTGTGGPVASGGTQPSNGSTPGTSGGTASQPPSGGQTSAPPPKHIVLNASLSKQCVTPGGQMTLTVQARPQMKVIFNTRYPDGKEGKEFGGFESQGVTDANGRYSKTWIVSPAVSPGDADVVVAAIDKYGSGDRRLEFRVARTCP